MICKYIDEYQADGLLINSIKSCNSFSAGQLLILREVEKRTGRPAAFIETDLVDPRYFSAANVKNRLESYFQMVKQKRTAAAGIVPPTLAAVAAALPPEDAALRGGPSALTH
jgi:benzoyl-CoA reductase subunit B